MSTATVTKKEMLSLTHPDSRIKMTETPKPAPPASKLNASAPEFRQNKSMHPASAISENHRQYLHSNAVQTDFIMQQPLASAAPNGHYAHNNGHYAYNNGFYQPPSFYPPYGPNGQLGHFAPPVTTPLAPPVFPPFIPSQSFPAANNGDVGYGHVPPLAVSSVIPFKKQLDQIDGMQSSGKAVNKTRRKKKKNKDKKGPKQQQQQEDEEGERKKSEGDIKEKTVEPLDQGIL